MNGIEPADLVLILPELILVGVAVGLLLVARRIRKGPVAMAGSLFAALAAALAAGWLLPSGPASGFAEMIIVDGYSQFFKILIAASLALVSLLSVRSIDGERVPRGDFHALLLLATTGMMLSVSALDLLTLYLGVELMTICSYILVGITVLRPMSNEAAIKYFLIATFASALLLFGISLTYGATGGTALEDIAAALLARGLASDTVLMVGMALTVAGLAFKIAAAPFHSWAPDAYQGASSPVAAFLASGSKAAGLAVLGRVTLVAFGSQVQVLSVVMAFLATLSIIVGSLIALAQTDMKRLLAYSSIAHVGYALLGLIPGTSQGVTATMIYAFFYVFMTLGAFGVVVALDDRGENLEGYRGLAAQRPLTAGLMLLFLLSLTGIPPTAGFVAKFGVILAAVRAGHLALAVLAVVFSVVSAFIYMRVAVFMFMQESHEEVETHVPVAVSAALAVAALVTLIGGIFPGGLVDWAVSP